MTKITLTEWAQAQTNPPADLELLRDVEYGRVGDRPLTMHILRPATLPLAPMPVLVGIHGGGWAGGTKDWCLEVLMHFATRGYFTVAIGHRFQKEAPFPSMIEDCKCAVRFLRAHANTYHLDANSIGAWGLSSGGHLAALLGTAGDVAVLEGDGGWPDQSSRVQAVCDWFGPTGKFQNDPAHQGRMDEHWELFGGTLRERLTQAILFDPIDHITPTCPPFLIMHGDKDTLVGVVSSERLYDALTATGVEASLVIVEGAGHGFTRYDTHSLMIRFFDQHLRGIRL